MLPVVVKQLEVGMIQVEGKLALVIEVNLVLMYAFVVP
jgi:hypothetical protein